MLVRRCVLRTPRRDKNQMSGPLAQSVEQLAFNQLVVGSNPTRPTTFQPVSQAGSTSWSLVRIQHGPPPFSRSPRLAQPVGRWFESNTAHQDEESRPLAGFFLFRASSAFTRVNPRPKTQKSRLRVKVP